MITCIVRVVLIDDKMTVHLVLFILKRNFE